MDKRKLIWPDFIDCKVVVVCRTEEIAKDFLEKLSKYDKNIDGNLRFITERYNFGWDSDMINFHYQKPDKIGYDCSEYIFAHWDEIMEYDKEMRFNKMQSEVGNGN